MCHKQKYVKDIYIDLFQIFTKFKGNCMYVPPEFRH